MTSEPTAAQAFHGAPLTTSSNVSCEDCTADLEAGDAITVQVHPREEWTPTAAYCSDCAPDTTDDHAIIVEGQLTVTIDPRADTQVLTVATTDYDLETLPLDTRRTGTDPPGTADHGPDSSENDDDPTENNNPDTTPNEDPSPEPARALISVRSNRSDRVFHFDDGEGIPLCDARGEFEAVPIDEASDHAPCACRDCDRAQLGRQQKRPCPHCGERSSSPTGRDTCRGVRDPHKEDEEIPSELRLPTRTPIPIRAPLQRSGPNSTPDRSQPRDPLSIPIPAPIPSQNSASPESTRSTTGS